MQIGKWQKMTIKSIKSPGAIMSEGILLPNKFVPEGTSRGDELEVFVMRDSDDRLMATTQKGKVEVGKFAYLRVIDISKNGAFLDWGMDKDLFLPYKEQSRKLKLNDYVLIYCYVDKTDRICATMKVQKYFSYPENVAENDWLDGIVYAINQDLGAFVLVDSLYNGMITKDKIREALKPGQRIRVRVERVKKDGKLELSMDSRAHEQIDKDGARIYAILEGAGGRLAFNDKSDPAAIKKEFSMSKSQFKRALGRLYKKRLISFKNEGIVAKQEKKLD